MKQTGYLDGREVNVDLTAKWDPFGFDNYNEVQIVPVRRPTLWSRFKCWLSYKKWQRSNKKNAGELVKFKYNLEVDGSPFDKRNKK